MHLHEWYGCMQSIQHGLLSNLAHQNGRCQRIRAVCSRTCHVRLSVTNVPTCVGAEMRFLCIAVRLGTANGCAPPTVSSGAATTREGRMKPHVRETHTARNQTVDAPSEPPKCPMEDTCPRTWCQQSYDGHHWHVSPTKTAMARTYMETHCER